jgi:hypothetical protein
MTASGWKNRAKALTFDRCLLGAIPYHKIRIRVASTIEESIAGRLHRRKLESLALGPE